MTPTEQYIAKGREILAGLPNDAARFDAVTKKIAQMEDRYQNFMDGGCVEGSWTAFDYTETIAALQILQSQYSPLKRIDTKDLDANVGRLKQTVEAM